MRNEIYISDNAGNRVPPHPNEGNVKVATGQKATNGTKDTDGTLTVLAGETYVFTSQITGGFYLGVADVTTDANKLWCCPIYQSVIFTIPEGITTLHFATDTNSGVGYLRQLENLPLGE